MPLKGHLALRLAILSVTDCRGQPARSREPLEMKPKFKWPYRGRKFQNVTVQVSHPERREELPRSWVFLPSFGAPISKHNNVGKAHFLAESRHFSIALRQARVLPLEVGLQISQQQHREWCVEPAVAALFPGNCVRLHDAHRFLGLYKAGPGLCGSSLVP